MSKSLFVGENESGIDVNYLQLEDDFLFELQKHCSSETTPRLWMLCSDPYSDQTFTADDCQEMGLELQVVGGLSLASEPWRLALGALLCALKAHNQSLTCKAD